MADGMHAHNEVLNLVKHSDATHVAVSDGSWFDPDTWSDGEVPGAGARVVIADGVTVDYDGVSDASLFTVRVDGALTFATDTDSRMVVDTVVVGHMGKLTIGTADDPVQEGVNADIIFANNGDIDVNWDPTLVSRGLVALGDVEVHGQEKSSHHKVDTDPMAGDTTITLDEIPTNWQVGDTVVIAGSEYDGYKWDNSIRAVRHYESEDEVRVITAVNGNTITFDQALEHDHDTPRDDLKISVANYSRNVTFATEDPDTAAVNERGHVMFHSRDTDVRYAAFDELGRTDKSAPALLASEFTDIAADSNVKGRYALHFHRNGTDDPENPAMAVGNSVFGSPGWGIVHHDSNAIIHNNATFDTFGAGYVAETGNEIGVWSDNIAIYAKGISWAAPKNGVDLENFDTGKTGDGFWFQGRLVKADGNIAASVNTGFVYFHRGASTNDGSAPGNINISADQFELPEALANSSSRGIDDAPILGFTNNETFASKEGLHVVKANPNQEHDVHSEFSDFTAWNVATGAHFEYTSHYLIKNFDVVARENKPFVNSYDGISFGPNVSDMTLVQINSEGFGRSGIYLLKAFTDDSLSMDLKQYTVVDATYTGPGTDILDYDPDLDVVVSSGDLPERTFSIDLDGPLTYREGYPDPDARKVDIRGTKTDSLGTTPIPSGTDNYSANRAEVVQILETHGWFETTTGEKVFFLEDYYSDRLTGEIFKVVLPVYIDDNVPLGNQFFGYTNAKYSGIVDLTKPAPETQNDTATMIAGQDMVIDILGNDSDPDGTPLKLDGLVQPLHAQVFDNGDGTITYRPFLGYTGVESVKYWVTDGLGNYTEGWLTVTVTAPIVDMVGTAGADSIAGDDLANSITGLAGADTLSGGDGDDTINGNQGHDTIEGNAGADVLFGASGDDTVLGGKDEDLIKGGGGKDALSGQGADDRIFGGAGNDELYGGAGDDVLSGGAGNDRLKGGDGRDRLIGGTGDDTLVGGNGLDRFVFNTGDGDDKIVNFEDGLDLINLKRTGETFADLTITDTAGGDVLIEYGVDDTILVEDAAGLIDRDDFLLS